MRAWTRFAPIVVLLGWCTSGCQHAAPAIPSNPVFVSKQPLISKSVLRPPEFVAYGEPDMPVGPVEAVAARSKMTAEAVPVTCTVRGQTAD